MTNEQDEFSTWAEGISNTASYSDHRELMRVVLKHYRAFKAKQEAERRSDSEHAKELEESMTAAIKEKQEAKPTAPASLVEELREMVKIEQGWCALQSGPITKGLMIGLGKVKELLSRHEARKEVVLAEGVGPILREDI